MMIFQNSLFCYISFDEYVNIYTLAYVDVYVIWHRPRFMHTLTYVDDT